MRHKFSLTAAVLLACVLLLSIGCWDQKDIGNLAVVRILAVDRITEKGQAKWRVAVLIMNPLPKNGGGGGGGGGQSETARPAKPEVPFIGTGVTMEEAVTDIARRMPRFPFFAHLSALIVGEQAAKERPLAMIELALRYRETRPNHRIMVADGEAMKVTESEPEVSRTLSEEIEELAERTIQPMGLSVDMTLAKFTSRLVSPDRDAVAPRIKLLVPTEKRREKPDKTSLIQGLAVFTDGKFAGWFDKEQTLGYILAAERVHSGDMRIEMQRDGKWFSYILRKANSQVYTTLINSKLYVTVKISTDGSVYEANGMKLSDDDIREVEGIASERIKQIVQDTVDKAKEYRSDCLGFTQNLHRWHVAQWKQIKDNRREKFANAAVNILVDAQVSDTGKIGEKF